MTTTKNKFKQESSFSSVILVVRAAKQKQSQRTVKTETRTKSRTRSDFREADPLTLENFGRRLSEMKILQKRDNVREIVEH